MAELFKDMIAGLEEQRVWMVNKLNRYRVVSEKIKIPKAVMTIQNVKLVEQILKAYVDSLTTSSWLEQRYWKVMQDKFSKFIKSFFPQANITQLADVVTPETLTLFNFLKDRFNIDFHNLEYQVRYGEPVEPALTLQKQVLADFQAFQNSTTKLYQLIDREMRDPGLSPYLCTIEVEPGGGSRNIHIWRTGDTFMLVSGDLDIRDEALVGILTRAYIYTYLHRQPLSF